MSVVLSGLYWTRILSAFASLTERPPEPIEVAWIPDLDDKTSQKDETPAPEQTPEQTKDKIKKEKERQKLAAPPEPAKLEEKKKEAELEIKPPPPQPPPPPPQPVVDHRMQMVDQDKFPDEQDNKDAHFLAQKNHKAAEETRAKETNLIREVQSENQPPTEKSDNKQPDPGAKNDKLAELQDRKGPKNELPRNAPMQGDEGKRETPSPPGPLAMRDLTPKAAIDEVKEEKAREGLDKQEEGKGDLPMARVGQAGQRAVTPKMGGKVNLNLNHHMYDQIEGFQAAEAERRQAALAQKSHTAGHWDRVQQKIAAWKSSIENFTPAVKPGNQSELGTRASPFAAYITAMHRQIHKLFTLGFLSEIDARGDSAYANDELWTQLEIVVKGDGSVERVGIVHGSGLLAFDTAAIDSVLSAAPFPPPPSVIKSANGKVYLDWQFHRDERACGTFGVDPHILTTVAENSDHDTSETGAQAKAMEKAARARGASAGGAGGGPLNLSGAGGEGPRRLQREPTPRPRGDDDIPSAKPPAPEVVVPEVTSEVRAAAEGWFAAYTRGDAAWLAGWSATPFTAAGEVVAHDAAALRAMYKQLLGEAPGKRAVSGMEVLTPAGIRGKLGGLPPGGEPSDMLFAVGKAGGEEFILLLKKSSQGWRVCGVDR